MKQHVINREDKRIITELKELIENKPEARYSIPGLAIKTGFNRTKLSTLFKKINSVSIHQYIIEVRIKKAKLLLGGTDKPIKAIAIECGYKNAKNFATVFKKTTGITPGEYQRGLNQ